MVCNPGRLQLDGTNQQERLTDALQTDYVLIDDRSEQDLYAYIYQVAAQLAYYNYAHQQEGDWQKLLPSTYDSFKQQIGSQPHLSLLWVFLQLFRNLQTGINQLTGKHLDFYYEQFLGFKKLAAKGDKVYVQFELNRQTDTQVLQKGIRFPAGKSGTQDLFYALDNEVVVNKATIAALQSVRVDELNEDRIYVAPVANSLDGTGKKMPLPGQGWRPFGESQFGKAAENRTMLPARFGFALASPVLLLLEGRRTVEITFASGDPLPYFTNVFTIVLSGEKGWLDPVPVGLTRAGQSFTLAFTLENNFPAVTLPQALLPEDRFPDNLPVAMVLIDETKSNNYFDNLKSIRVSNIDINVAVEGLRKTCLLENDQASLNATKAFQPFGSVPQIGSTFTIRNQEVLQKTITSFSVEMDWKGLPSNFDQYYSAYHLTSGSFIGKARINFNGKWVSKNYYLFGSPPTGHPLFSYTDADFHTDLNNYQPVYDDELFDFELINPTAPIEAFGHQRYPTLLSDALIKKVTVPLTDIPNPPYTPLANNLSVGYKATAALAQINVYQVEPFGVSNTDTTGADFSLFPQWEEKAALFIGFQDLPTPSQLNVLWELAVTSDSNELPPTLTWSILKGNTWHQLSTTEILGDQTLNWQQTGIISMAISDTSGPATTLMQPDLVWLKAAVQEYPDKVKPIISVATQVASATLVPSTIPLQYEGQPLPAGTIQKMELTLPAIKTVLQPLASFGGRPRETADQFYARVSERLRHKNRAICLWDYEHLVLEQFPQLFKVKCLVHADAASDYSPGNITLIIIPGFKERSGQVNPLEPAINLVLQNQIKTFILAYTSPHVIVYVQNPVYEQVLVDLKVKFRPGYDPGYYRGLLLNNIDRFLSPWAFEDGRDILFENKIHKSVLWSYLESLEYVDYIADFKLYHAHAGPDTDGLGCMEIGVDFKVWEPPYSVIGEAGVLQDNDMIIGESFVIGFDTEQAAASTSRSVLVSSLFHRVEALVDTAQVCRGASDLGIGQTIIEWDFVVAGNCEN